MHKSSFSTNNFGNIHLGKKYHKQKILRILADYNGVCLKKFQRIEQKLENVFSAKFEIFVTLKNRILFHQ